MLPSNGPRGAALQDAGGLNSTGPQGAGDLGAHARFAGESEMAGGEFLKGDSPHRGTLHTSIMYIYVEELYIHLRLHMYIHMYTYIYIH